MFLQSQKLGQSLRVLKGCISYCFNGLCFWMQQPAVIVLYVRGNTLESRMKATGYDFSLIVQLHLVSYGETLHICKRKLFIPLGEA